MRLAFAQQFEGKTNKVTKEGLDKALRAPSQTTSQTNSFVFSKPQHCTLPNCPPRLKARTLMKENAQTSKPQNNNYIAQYKSAKQSTGLLGRQKMKRKLSPIKPTNGRQSMSEELTFTAKRQQENKHAVKYGQQVKERQNLSPPKYSRKLDLLGTNLSPQTINYIYALDKFAASMRLKYRH